MKLPILLLALVLLGSALPQRSFGQTPWAVATGAPNFYYGGFSGGAQLHRVLPNVLWGSYYEYVGLGISSSKLFMSTDNGQTWQYLTVASVSGAGSNNSFTGERLSDVDVLDGQYAWLLAKNAANGALILKKTVSGITGFVTLAAPPAGFTTVHFFTATTGIAVVKVGAVYRTTDGGSTWAQVATIPSYATAPNDDVVFKQSVSNSLWLTTTNGALLRTADGGLTWTSTADISKKVVFENVLDGLAYQMDPTPKLLRTADGGATWTAVAFSGQPQLTDLTPMPGRPGTYLSVGSQRAGAIATGTTAITRDRGATWQVLGTDDTLFGTVAALSDTEIWASPAPDFVNQSHIQKMLLRYSGVALAARNAADPTRALLAYPNPTNGLVQLAGGLQSNETVRVYDAAGRLCQQGQVSDARRTLDLSAQPVGLYQVRVTAPDGSIRSQRVSKAQ